VTRDLKALHVTALEQFKVTALAEEAQRERELTDLKFADPIDPTDQWPKDALDSRAGLPAQGSLPPVPPRPALTINKLRQPILQIQNQQRQARLSLEFSPEGDESTVDVAEAFEDIARAIQNDSRAHLARNWAFDRQLRCGRGFYRIETEYLNDRSFDQRIVYKRILNQFSVYFYPFCQEPDFSDAEWCFITDDMPWPEYKRIYKESDLASYDDAELTGLGDDLPTKGWVTDSKEGKTIRVAEYFFFENTPDTLLALSDGRVVLLSELPEKPLAGQILQKRAVEVRKLRWGKMNAVEFLTEPGLDTIVERDGRYIPVVPVIGDEQNRHGERIYTGIVRPAMDSCRLFNVEASSLAEAVHLGPIAPFVGYANQFAGYETWWAQLNTRRFPYLPVNAPTNVMEAGLPLPQRNTAEQPIQAIVVSLQHASSYVDSTTGSPPVSRGEVDPTNRSGKAIEALQHQAEQGSAGYLDNLANMSMLLEGKILRDLIPKIYDRPGRAVSSQGDDDERGTILLNTPFVTAKNGEPQAIPRGQQPPPEAKIIDLKKGEYAVTATVGKSYPTKRRESVGMMGELAQAAPEIVPAFADLWVKNMDFPGAKQIADRLARAVPPQFRDQAEGADPQQQLQQAMAVIQELQPLADKNKADLMKVEAQQKGENERVQFERTTEMQEKAAELASKERLELRKLEVQLEIEMAKLGSAQSLARGEAEQQQLHQHNEQALRREELGAEQAQADLDRQSERESSEREHEQSLEQGAQQAESARQLQAEKPQPNGASA
jgi:hypothetical protein